MTQMQVYTVVYKKLQSSEKTTHFSCPIEECGPLVYIEGADAFTLHNEHYPDLIEATRTYLQPRNNVFGTDEFMLCQCSYFESIVLSVDTKEPTTELQIELGFRNVQHPDGTLCYLGPRDALIVPKNYYTK